MANVAEDFSGIIDLTEGWEDTVERIDARETSGDVEITGNSSTKEIKIGSGNDKVCNISSSAIIRTGSGDDMILNSGNENSILASSGNDTIVNFGDENTIFSGSGNDTILNSGNENTIFASAGNDTILNSGNENTIFSGAGNDTITSEGAKNIFSYDSGGNKIIYGFGATDTLKIAKHLGTYSKKKSGKNIVVTVGNGKISLMGAASLSSVNVKSVKSPLLITLTKKADEYYNYHLDEATIKALDGNDEIYTLATMFQSTAARAMILFPMTVIL